MNEEKKLDEKTLDQVTGGSAPGGYVNFLLNNCNSCGHHFNSSCPYGSASKALEEFGAGAECPGKEGLN